MLKMVDFFKAQDLTQVPFNTLYVDVMYVFAFHVCTYNTDNF